MSAMMFYERLAPLNRDVHARLKLRATGFTFAAKTNSAPLLAVELPEAARSFPILFVDIGQEQIFPIALLGLRRNQNLFVDSAGVWEAGRYVPAFVRRYPFVLSNDLTVCIDENFEGLSEEDGEPLFTDAGENTPQLEHALAFLRGFHDEVDRTHALVKTLQALDLLKPVGLNVVPESGAEYRIDGLLVVDAEKLAALDDAEALKLFRSGELAWIQAHIGSLGGLDELNRRSESRERIAPADQGSTAEPVAEAAMADAEI